MQRVSTALVVAVVFWALVMTEAGLPDPVCRLLAGGFASAVAKSSTAPFERVKLILQTSQTYSGPVDALVRLPREEGIASLWRGNLANLARIVPTYALRFALLDYFRAAVRPRPADSGAPLALTQELFAGAMTGATVCFVGHPLDVVRTQLAVSSSKATQDIITTLRKLVRAHGWSGPYRGILISLIEIAPYTALSLGGYEYLKGLSQAAGRGMDPRAKLCASWLSGICASLVCYPLDSVKRRLMMDAVRGDSLYRGSILRCVSSVIRTEGLRSLYRGCVLNALKSAPTFALTATLNDGAKQWLGCGH